MFVITASAPATPIDIDKIDEAALQREWLNRFRDEDGRIRYTTSTPNES